MKIKYTFLAIIITLIAAQTNAISPEGAIAEAVGTLSTTSNDLSAAALAGASLLSTASTQNDTSSASSTSTPSTQ